MSEQKTSAEKIAELHEIAARVKALRDTLPADSRGRACPYCGEGLIRRVE